MRDKRRDDRAALYRIPVEEFSPRQWAEVATMCVMGARVMGHAAAPASEANALLSEAVQIFSIGEWQAAALLALKEWKPVEESQLARALNAAPAVVKILKTTGLLVRSGGCEGAE